MANESTTDSASSGMSFSALLGSLEQQQTVPHSLSIELRNQEILAWLMQNKHTYQISFSPVNQQQHKQLTDGVQLGGKLAAKKRVADDRSSNSGSSITASSKEGRGASGKRSRAFALREIGSSRISRGVVAEMQQPIQPMVDSSSLFQTADAEALWQRYTHDGYLYLPRVLNASTVQEAREGVMQGLQKLSVLAEDGQSAAATSGWTVELGTGVVISGTNTYASESIDAAAASIWKSVGDGTAMKSIPHSATIRRLLSLLAEGRTAAEGHICQPRLFHKDFRWLRVKAKGEMTVEHADEFYYHMHTSMFQPPEEPVDAIVCSNCGSGDREDEILLCDECGRGFHMDCLDVPLQAFPEGEWFCKSCSLRPTLGTIWVPLEDVSAEHGVLAMLASSQHLSNFTKNYRKSQLPASYFREAHGMTWHTTDYTVGDLVIFDSRIIHATSKNYCDAFRLSLDFRWYIVPGRPDFGSTPHAQFILNHTEPIAGDGTETLQG